MASNDSTSSTTTYPPPSKSLYKVCVSRVPESLRCGNPQAFKPQFVGLGPYHGFDDNSLTITTKLKLAAARQVLDSGFVNNNGEHLKTCHVSGLYHADVNYDSDILREGLTTDGLFLLGLLYSYAPESMPDTSFFTGKRGMPLVNDARVELTMDAVISDVFMLENQIPTHVLLHINRRYLITDSNNIETHSLDHLGAKMLTFCKKYCPLVLDNSQEISGKPEERDHLLDLLYHLSAPPEPHKSISEADKSNSETQNGEAANPDANPNDSSNTEPTESLLCSIFLNILMFFVILAVVLGFFVYHIWKLFKRLVSRAFELLKKLPKALSAVGTFFDVMAQNKYCIPLAKNFNQLQTAVEQINMENDARPAVTIPSVTELNGAGIHFEPVKGGISKLKYNKETCQFFLPVIKLDGTSEVIIRNLVAYEALTRATYLIFGRYVEIMRAIIDTPEDVKLLVNSKIIETELSDQVVADLFNGMNRSIKPTDTPDLEEEIKKVNAKFDESQWLQRVMIKYVYRSWKLLTVVAALVFLVLTAVQTYCTIYNCSSRRSSNLAGDWDYYATNNHFISSM